MQDINYRLSLFCACHDITGQLSFLKKYGNLSIRAVSLALVHTNSSVLSSWMICNDSVDVEILGDFAAKRGNCFVLKWMLDRGLEIHESVIRLAAMHGHVEILDFLLHAKIADAETMFLHTSALLDAPVTKAVQQWIAENFLEDRFCRKMLAEFTREYENKAGTE